MECTGAEHCRSVDHKYNPGHACAERTTHEMVFGLCRRCLATWLRLAEPLWSLRAAPAIDQGFVLEMHRTGPQQTELSPSLLLVGRPRMWAGQSTSACTPATQG
jgi:hypothetical protein